MSLIIVLNKSQLLFKMRVAVQGLRMERNRRLLWDMMKIIFNSLMTILIFGLLIGMENFYLTKDVWIAVHRL